MTVTDLKRQPIYSLHSVRRVYGNGAAQVQAVWLNLLQVSYILPDPPADKGCGRCQGAVTSS